MITSTRFMHMVCSSCRNTQVDPQDEGVLTGAARDAVLLARDIGWHVPDDDGHLAVCPTCLRAINQCLDFRQVNGRMEAGHRFDSGYLIPGTTRFVRRCYACEWVDDPARRKEPKAGLVRVSLWSGECDACQDAYGPWEVPLYRSRTEAVRTLQSQGWTVKTRKGEPVLVRCKDCTVERLCCRDGCDFGEWEPLYVDVSGYEVRYCDRDCRNGMQTRLPASSAGEFALAGGEPA